LKSSNDKNETQSSRQNYTNLQINNVQIIFFPLQIISRIDLKLHVKPSVINSKRFL